MNPYLFTITFLMMMGLLTSSEAIRFSQSALENTYFLSGCRALAAAEEQQAFSHLEELRDIDNDSPKKRAPKTKKQNETTKRIAPLHINTARPPNNSRLNIYTLLHKEPHESLPEDFSLYESLARLMRALYQDAPFFNEVPSAEYRILDTFMEQQTNTDHFTTPDELSTLSFDDPSLQKIFYHMLKGTKQAPSLLHFITFDKIDSPRKQARKLNFLFADERILKAIFPDGKVVEKLLVRREKILTEILDQEEHRLQRSIEEGKGRSGFAKDLSTALEEVLISENLDAKRYKTHVFDCTLNEPGTVLFIEDPLTHALIREKYIPPVKRSKK